MEAATVCATFRWVSFALSNVKNYIGESVPCNQSLCNLNVSCSVMCVYELAFYILGQWFLTGWKFHSCSGNSLWFGAVGNFLKFYSNI